MTFVACNDGEAVLLPAMVGKVAAGNLLLKLYTNNVTPTDTDTAATYTEMGAVQSYVAKTLLPATWGAVVPGTGTGTGTSNAASITYPQQTWTADGTGGAQTVYGYFLIDATSTKLVGAEKFATPQPFTTAGDVVRVTPQLTLSHA